MEGRRKLYSDERVTSEGEEGGREGEGNGWVMVEEALHRGQEGGQSTGRSAAGSKARSPSPERAAVKTRPLGPGSQLKALNLLLQKAWILSLSPSLSPFLSLSLALLH